MFARLKDEIDSYIARDPAARSRVEVLLSYPSFHAIALHRVSHWLWLRRWRLTARWLSYVARLFTGIEIHPGARIGRRFFIDHGLGVVIGETAEIGDDVTLYHDVTLGGLLPSVNSRSQVGVKRHPTLRDRVIVGSGAQILGPITVGEDARVGANAVVVTDVVPGTTVVGIPAKATGAPRLVDRALDFCAYGTEGGRMPDPTEEEIENLVARMQALSARVAELEARLDGGAESRGEVVEGPRAATRNPPARSRN
ncbi:serine O-acetyltransferase [Zavarzinia compransoris]|uniref:serine O-acetyltransferase n=1 Tax=Zavarzinia marina TaxID=2911065 RepID=UPI001F21D328|nr:serine O-acetyltransferase [Zavarzinia marina]MCF4164526.1 serine O-acetyltransferase [Zavarzinia marina]